MQMHKDSQMHTVLLVSIQCLNESSKNWVSRKGFLRSRILSNHTTTLTLKRSSIQIPMQSSARLTFKVSLYLLDNNTRPAFH